MDDINSFYEKITNLKGIDKRVEIERVVANNTKNMPTDNSNYEGLCRVLAANIGNDLKERGISTEFLDLNEKGVDHTALLATYMDDEGMHQILIDPSFRQFTKKNDRELYNMEDWPSNFLSENMVTELNTKGFFEVSDEELTNYVSSFQKSKKI